MSTLTHAIERVGLFIDAAGVMVIVAGIVVALVRLAVRPVPPRGLYRRFRQDLGRGILLGLEFLVAADIVRTVAVAPSLENVLVLGVIVLIRTFLSMALQVEVDGRWPWQAAPAVEVVPGGAASGVPAPADGRQ